MEKNKYGITYHEDYNKYDLGAGHPLIGDKPRKTIEFLKEKSLMKEIKLFTPEKAKEEDLLRVHTKSYVDLVKELSKTGGMLAIDTPAPIGIFESASLAAGGTILGGEKLFEGFNCVINPLAGFHHAGKNRSSGFCFFNDIAIAIEYLREKQKLKKFLIVDVDVHHGNGTQEIYYDDKTVLNISFHQDGRTLYPGTGFINEIGGDNAKGFTVNLPLPPGTTGKSYIEAFKEIVPPLTKQFKPEIIVYQAGVDTHHSDPLADLLLTYQTYYDLAKHMIELSNITCKKLLVLLGGGYNSSTCIISYYNIICGLLDKNDYVKEEEPVDYKSKQVKILVNELKNNLTNYWNLK
ncbi:MAG: histone deacetylase family protein [Thermoplasmatota archaeon]